MDKRVLGLFARDDKGVCILMEKKNNGWGIALGILLALVGVVVALALIIRTEQRLLRLVGKVEKLLPIKAKKTEPITVEL